ncbi:double-strand break repair helicase AddA [Aquibaculum sediminis]|uniref:double-strand break repair helicase AddA n=1 Tax=Aquibaculum sediminis TaxID=3231907 RepID=UPI003454A627
MSQAKGSAATPEDLRLEKRARATALQLRAADPEASVWVNASAGTGKTKVLTDRVLTLLLRGTPPERLLCLTFTKAAAAEMRNRLAKVLQHWATSDEEVLTDRLFQLLGRPAEPEESLRARQLLARVLDSPGGMKIQTIHGFCQSVLSRFPLEAGVAPHFRLIEEQGAGERLAAARDRVLADAGRNPALAEALARITPLVGEGDFASLLQALVGERGRLHELLAHFKGPEALSDAVARQLGVPADATPEACLASACAEASFEGAALRRAVVVMETGTTQDWKRAALLRPWLAAGDTDRQELWESYLSVFFKSDGEKRDAYLTKKLCTAHPDAEEALQNEALRLERVRETHRALTLACGTRALLRLGAAVLKDYERGKREHALLDYDDLILCTRDLLRRAQITPWVLYKLDGGLDHLLIDEAQDTNPEQWEVVKLLTEEFFAGEGAAEARLAGPARSLFAVGDAKQSIYRFQRADPEQFTHMQGYFAGRAREAERRWDPVDLIHSFRSNAAVLRLVDQVFQDDEAQRGLHFRQPWLAHDPVRVGQGGRVELWPAPSPEKEEEEDPWVAVPGRRSQAAPLTRLARLIATRISAWINSPHAQTGDEAWLDSRDRPLRAGDILVLVRRRNAFVEELIRELKQRNVPVAGSDRMTLMEQLAVMDLVALGRSLLLPEDDLTLATALKGPLIGFSEEQLFDLAWNRPGSLWAALQARAADDEACHQALDFLKRLSSQARTRPPFELYAELLAQGGRTQLLRRLGPDAADPIEEFLNLARAYERDSTVSLEGFLHWLESSPRQIKRDMEAGGEEVRIMTVHGAKGLQAPVVFLPDTLQLPNDRTRLLWLVPQQDEPAPLPLWTPRQELEVRAAATARRAEREAMAEEQHRLLYVALTRAEDRLYICGWHTSKRAPQGNWYELVQQAFASGLAQQVEFDFTEELPEGEGWSGEGWRIEAAQTTSPDTLGETANAARTPPLPAWVQQQPMPEQAPTRPLAPSRPAQNDPAPRSPLQGSQDGTFRRGILIHRLLQSLPDLPAGQRAAVGRRWLAQPQHGLADDTAESLLAEVLAVLDTPDFAPLFGPGSRAEVPIAGLVQTPEGPLALSGQLDRLYVDSEQVLVVDFKTNRPPPQTAAQVAPAYLRQMAAYRALLRDIYPGRQLHCALLWTDGPRLMPLDSAILDTILA